MTAMRSLADGSEKTYNPSTYETLPSNSSGLLYYYIFRNGSLIDRSQPESVKTGDIAVNIDRRRAEFVAPAYVRQIGTLSSHYGLSEFDVKDFYVVPRNSKSLRTGGFAEFLFYKKSRTVDWRAVDLERQFPPDAIFSLGRWVKGAELFSSKAE